MRSVSPHAASPSLYTASMMHRTLLFATLVLSLNACAVTVTTTAPTRPGVVVIPNDTVYVSDSLRLRPYPGSSLLKHEQKAHKAKAEFTTGAGLDGVYGYFHGQLVRAGWQRSAYKAHPSGRGPRHNPAERVDARYSRAQERLMLKLNKEGKSGRYKLDLDY